VVKCQLTRPVTFQRRPSVCLCRTGTVRSPDSSALRSGVTVDLGEDAGIGPDEFADLLGRFLDACEADGKRGVWLSAPLEATHLVPVAVEMGFTYHHADADGAVLTLWLPEDEPNGLPSYPHIGHGVGGIVLNARGEVLGIQEKAGVTAGRTSFWKIPGVY
jgi:hypothetical protein